MRSTALAVLLAAGLISAAPASTTLTEPAIPPLPGLSEEADQSLWCATMASQLAQSALDHGDQQTFAVLAPLALALSRQVSTLFVVHHLGEPDIRGYLDLYATEINAVIAGTAPQRYAPEQCQGMVVPQVLI
jgi:hypothetical protein